MSQTPKPDKHDSGQVRSLTKHRAEITGQKKSSIYETYYQRGERIICDDPSLAYVVTSGRVRVQKEMQTRGGRKLVTVDLLDKGHPLLDSRFIANARDDGELQFYADTDAAVDGYPVASLSKLFSAHEFLFSYSQTASRRLNGLREAFFKQLLRYQERLEEIDALKDQVAEAGRKIDELADDNLGQQMTIGELQRKADDAEKALSVAKSDTENARRETRAIREREKSAIAKAREAFEYFQSLEQRQREESQQFPELIKKVLAYFGIAGLSTQDLMFVITEAVAGKKAVATMPLGIESENSGLFTPEELSAAVAKPQPPPLPMQPTAAIILDPEDDCADVSEDELVPLDSVAYGIPASRPMMSTHDFEAEEPTDRSGIGTSGYCLMGGEIAQDAGYDEDDSHTPTLPPPDAVLDRIENLPRPGPRASAPECVTSTKPMLPAMPIGVIRGLAPRPKPQAKKLAPSIQPQASTEPFDEEAPTSKGMAPISCPIGAPFADLDEIVQSTTKTIDVSAFSQPRPKK